MIPLFSLPENSVSSINSPFYISIIISLIPSCLSPTSLSELPAELTQTKLLLKKKEGIVNCKWYGTLRTDMFSVKLEKWQGLCMLREMQKLQAGGIILELFED